MNEKKKTKKVEEREIKKDRKMKENENENRKW